MRNALVTGATGFVGRHLLGHLETPTVLSRNAESARERLNDFDIRAFPWQPADEMPPEEAFDEVEVIFHLAGDSVAEGRWNTAKKNRIKQSRVAGTRNLVQRLAELDCRPQVFIAASAVGYYGWRGDELLDETSSRGTGFLADVCNEWERESQQAEQLGMRVAMVRVGIVLGQGGGALAKMLTPFRLGLGGRLGNGRQWMPWIHIDDLVGLMLHAANNESVTGPVNGTAPNPVINREFTRSLAATLGRPAIFPAPRLGLRVLFGEFANELFGSQRVVPRVAEQSGYEFKFSEIEGALQDILR